MAEVRGLGINNLRDMKHTNTTYCTVSHYCCKLFPVSVPTNPLSDAPLLQEKSEVSSLFLNLTSETPDSLSVLRISMRYFAHLGAMSGCSSLTRNT